MTANTVISSENASMETMGTDQVTHLTLDLGGAFILPKPYPSLTWHVTDTHLLPLLNFTSCGTFFYTCTSLDMIEPYHSYLFQYFHFISHN